MRSIRGRGLFPNQFKEQLIPTIETTITEQVQERTTKSNVVQDIIAQKTFKQEKYLELVKQFIDQTCEYKFMNMVAHIDVRNAWNQFLRINHDKIKHLNIAWALTPGDISKLDNRFTYKRVHICKSCKHKQYSKCCDDYALKHRTTHNYMVHMALKSLE